MVPADSTCWREQGGGRMRDVSLIKAVGEDM